MRWKNLILFIFFINLLLVACKKSSKNIGPSSGIYRGVLSKIYSSGDTVANGILFLAINPADSGYTVNNEVGSLIPLPHGGGYSLIGNNQIRFENFTEINPEVLEDENFVLDTTYTYEFEDSTFTMTFLKDTIRYSYNLRRY